MLGLKLVDWIVIVIYLVGITFMVHEMSHKYTAIHYGHDARFVLNLVSISIALVLALVGWTMIWVGAAYIMAKRGLTIDEGGKISLAGPLSNLVMGLFGIILQFVVLSFHIGFGLFLGYSLPSIVSLFVILNAFIGGFNMLPFWILDGRKIFDWDKAIWLSLTLGLITLFFISIYLTLLF